MDSVGHGFIGRVSQSIRLSIILEGYGLEAEQDKGCAGWWLCSFSRAILRHMTTNWLLDSPGSRPTAVAEGAIIMLSSPWWSCSLSLLFKAMNSKDSSCHLASWLYFCITLYSMIRTWTEEERAFIDRNHVVNGLICFSRSECCSAQRSI